MSAASGNVSTQGITTNGGAININSAGAIATNGQTLDATNGSYKGGAMSLSAANGSINTGDLRSGSYSDFGSAGSGGAMSLSAANGSINTGDLRSETTQSRSSTVLTTILVALTILMMSSTVRVAMTSWRG